MKKIVLGIMVIVMGCLMVSAETYQHKEGGISIWFPDNWKINMEEDLLDATAPDEDAFIQLLILTDVESIEAAVEAYDSELSQIITNYKETQEAQEFEVNGMNGVMLGGEGKIEGIKMEVGVAIIETKKAYVMLMWYNTPESNPKYEKSYDKIVNSIKSIK